MKNNNINIDITGIVDYLRDKDIEIDCLKKINFDYKQRIKKATYLLKKAGCYDEDTKMFCDNVWDELDDLLNILQGNDNNV